MGDGFTWASMIEMVLRWLHFLFGVTWIGHLYYFNFTQGTYLNDAEVDAASKISLRRKLLPVALSYFRWGAMWTLVTGILYWGHKSHSYSSFMIFLQSNYGWTITVGALLGITMWYNVWFIIWPNQKIVIANAEALSKGQAANPAAAAAGTRANVASRTNTLLSIPMLFFMGAASHLPFHVGDNTNYTLFWAVFLLTWALIEFNAIKGQTYKLMTTVGQVIHSGIGLTVVWVALLMFCV